MKRCPGDLGFEDIIRLCRFTSDPYSEVNQLVAFYPNPMRVGQRDFSVSSLRISNQLPARIEGVSIAGQRDPKTETASNLGVRFNIEFIPAML